MSKSKKYNAEGMRMTDCCGACSTYDQNGELYCKACYKEVSFGEGDGNEYDSYEPDADDKKVFEAFFKN